MSEELNFLCINLRQLFRQKSNKEKRKNEFKYYKDFHSKRFNHWVSHHKAWKLESLILDLSPPYVLKKESSRKILIPQRRFIKNNFPKITGDVEIDSVICLGQCESVAPVAYRLNDEGNKILKYLCIQRERKRSSFHHKNNHYLERITAKRMGEPTGLWVNDYNIKVKD